MADYGFDAPIDEDGNRVLTFTIPPQIEVAVSHEKVADGTDPETGEPLMRNVNTTLRMRVTPTIARRLRDWIVDKVT